MQPKPAKCYSQIVVYLYLSTIGDLKAPGPDGMGAIFYKKFWEIVGEKVTREVLLVMRGGQIPEGWNATIIALIPKVQGQAT